jgi:hypothetical protein
MQIDRHWRRLDNVLLGCERGCVLLAYLWRDESAIFSTRSSLPSFSVTRSFKGYSFGHVYGKIIIFTFLSMVESVSDGESLLVVRNGKQVVYSTSWWGIIDRLSLDLFRGLLKYFGKMSSSKGGFPSICWQRVLFLYYEDDDFLNWWEDSMEWQNLNLYLTSIFSTCNIELYKCCWIIQGLRLASYFGTCFWFPKE